MIRVYIPTTLTGLGRAQEQGRLEANPKGEICAHAVTAAVREWYVEGNDEELEFSALIDAAQESLALLAVDPDAPRRRVVLALDVAEQAVTATGRGRSGVRIGAPVKLSTVVSVHVDELEAQPTVAAAVGALGPAAAGDEDAQFLLDEAEACDLLWYDISEVDDLIG